MQASSTLRVLALVGLSFVPLSLVAQATEDGVTEKPALSGFEALVPSDAVAVIASPSFERMNSVVREIAIAFGAERDADQALGFLPMMALGQGAPALDEARPFMVAVSLPSEDLDAPPGAAVTVVVPVKADADTAMLTEAGFTRSGAYAARVMDLNSMGGGTPAKLQSEVSLLLGGLQIRDLSIRVDMARIMEQYAKIMLFGIGMVGDEIAGEGLPDGFPIDELLSAAESIVEDMEESADRLHADFQLVQGQLVMDGRMTFIKESPWDKAARGAKGAVTQRYAKMLTGNPVMAFASGIDMSPLLKGMADMLESMVESGGFGMGGMEEAMMGPAIEVYGLMSGRAAFSMDFGQKGFSMLQVVETTDIAKYKKMSKSILENPMFEELGIAPKLGEPVQVGGQEVGVMTMSLESLVDIVSVQMPEEAADAMEEVIEKLFPGGSITQYQTSIANDFFIGVGMSSEEMVARAKGQSTGAARSPLEPLLKEAGKAPLMAMSFDVGRMMSRVGGLMEQMSMPGGPSKREIDIMKGVPAVPFGLYMGADTNRRDTGSFKWGFRLAVKPLGKMVKQLDGM